jgi:PBP superfamily domain
VLPEHSFAPKAKNSRAIDVYYGSVNLRCSDARHFYWRLDASWGIDLCRSEAHENPQLGNVAPNGTPIYTGFLSIELRDKNGQTIWSYLATPPAASGDVSKDLSVLIAKKLSEALEQGEAPTLSAPLPQPTTVLSGAGATFPLPVYEKCFTNYRNENPTVQITYEPIGSAAGVLKLLSSSVDFGASDSPEVIHELAPGDDDKYLFFPSVVGAVVPVVNLPGVQGDIQFTPEALARNLPGDDSEMERPDYRMQQ